MKRIVVHPPAKRQRGGWVFLTSKLIEAARQGEAVEFDKVMVGSQQLTKLLRLMPYPDVFVRVNGGLEFETVERKFSRDGESHVITHFRRPKHEHHFFHIVDRAWLKCYEEPSVVVVIRPKKY